MPRLEFTVGISLRQDKSTAQYFAASEFGSISTGYQPVPSGDSADEMTDHRGTHAPFQAASPLEGSATVSVAPVGVPPTGSGARQIRGPWANAPHGARARPRMFSAGRRKLRASRPATHLPSTL